MFNGSPNLKKISSSKSQLETVFGVIISISGFALQFQGLRGLNWASALVQLVAIAIMTALRAWLRRGLIETPIAR